MEHFGWTTPWQQLAFSVHQQTRSWDGGIKSNLGAAIVIRDESGFGMDRDLNGARGIFLRALGDSPFLRGLLTQVASLQTNVSSIVY